MKIESIRIKNYKSFQDVEMDKLPELAIFVGANGVGKTTLFDVFGFLSDALNNNIRQALAKRGGFKEVISRNQQVLEILTEEPSMELFLLSAVYSRTFKVCCPTLSHPAALISLYP